MLAAPRKIPLSQCTDVQAALRVIAQQFAAVHAQKAQSFPQHAVFVGMDSDVLANALQYYLDGGAIDIVTNDQSSVKVDHQFNEEFLTEIAANIFENDLSDEQIAQLPIHHPIRLLKTLFALQQAENEGYNVDDEKAPLLNIANELMQAVINEIKTQDRHLQLRDLARIKNISGQQVTLDTPQGEVTIATGAVVHRDGNMLRVEQLDLPPVLSQNSGMMEARSMHERMLRSEKFRDQIEKSVYDFANTPNRDADELFQRVRRDRPNVPNRDRPKVTVVGLGPSGAWAAIRAYQQGAIVTGVEKRQGYSRNNVFRFTPEIVDEIIKLFVDKPSDIPNLPPDHPLRKVIDSKSLTERRKSPIGEFYAISIKDCEYLLNCWLDLVAQKDPEGMKIYRGWGYIPGCIQTQRGQIDITDGPLDRPLESRVKRIPTDLVVAADGYHSQCRKDCGIELEEMSTGTSYATFTYFPKRGDANSLFSSLLNTTPRKAMDVSKLKAMGWEFDRLPVPRYFNTGEHPYLGIEVPNVIAVRWREYNQRIRTAREASRNEEAYQLKQERDTMLDQWGRACLEMFLTPTEIQELAFKECAIIDVKLMRAKQTTKIMPNAPVVLIGDSAQAAHFQTGRGAITGIEEANDVGECVQGMVQKKPLKDVLAHIEKNARRKTLSLHEIAFHFPTGEDLRIKPTTAYKNFREDVRVEIIQENPRDVRPETQREAQTKAQTKIEKFKR